MKHLPSRAIIQIIKAGIRIFNPFKEAAGGYCTLSTELLTDCRHTSIIKQ